MGKGFGVVVESTFLQLQSKLCLCSWVGLKLFFPGKLYLATNISRSHLKYNTSYLCSCTYLWFRYFVGEVHVVIVYDCLDILHSALTHFNIISVECLVKSVFFGKWRSIRYKKDWLILVVALSICDGLNHITFRW